MRFTVLVRALALTASRGKQIEFQIELHDATGVTVRHHDVLAVAHQAQPAGRARMRLLAQEFAVAIEDLQPLVGTVGDDDLALRIDQHRMRLIELTGVLALATPGQQEGTVGVELHHTRLAFAVTLRHIKLALRSEGDVIGFVETAQMPGLMPVGRTPLHTQHHLDAAFGIHFDDDVRNGIRGPDIALCIQPQPVRVVEHAATQRTQIHALRIEFHQRMFIAAEHQNVAIGTHRHR